MFGQEKLLIKHSSSKTTSKAKKNKLLVNIKIPAKVQNPDKALELIGGKSELLKVTPFLQTQFRFSETWMRS